VIAPSEGSISQTGNDKPLLIQEKEDQANRRNMTRARRRTRSEPEETRMQKVERRDKGLLV
jgi:hypothetical protein